MKKLTVSSWAVLLLFQMVLLSCGKEESMDTTAPVINCPADITLDCHGSILPANTGAATATDDQDPTPAITFVDATNNSNPSLIIITRTWTATDSSGNVNNCSQTITINDVTHNFIGFWTVSENWNKLTYEVAITSDPISCDGVYIENFAGSGTGVKTHAKISGNKITISPLPQTLGNGWIIESGSGNLQQGSTKITWNYIFNDLANTYTAIATYTKK
jgi:hypothetical protein